MYYKMCPYCKNQVIGRDKKCVYCGTDLMKNQKRFFFIFNLVLFLALDVLGIAVEYVGLFKVRGSINSYEIFFVALSLGLVLSMIVSSILLSKTKASKRFKIAFILLLILLHLPALTLTTVKEVEHTKEALQVVDSMLSR